MDSSFREQGSGTQQDSKENSGQVWQDFPTSSNGW